MINETRKINKIPKKFILTVAGVIVAGLAVFSTYAGYIYNKSKAWQELIYPGANVKGLELSGKTKDEARDLLISEYADKILKKKIIINAGDKMYSVDYSKLNAGYNIDDVVEEAFSYGKDLSILEKYNVIKNPVDRQYELKFSYDGQYVKEVIALMEKEINKGPVNASIKMVSSGKFEVTPDVKGYRLKTAELEKEIIDKINGKLEGDVNVKAPIEELTAAVTGAMLSNINTKISSFSTNFATSSNERASNIGLATKAINGKLLMPGDTFSFNETVGRRTAARGYKDAPVIIKGKIESDLGGGICQVSSTLYNALLKTGVDRQAIARAHHSIPSSYVPLGQDATVDWGNIDFKFKNTLDYPIWIEGYAKNRNLYFNFYSSSNLTKQTYSVASHRYETVKASVKYIDDPNLPEGETVEVDKPRDGYRVKVIKNTYENKKLVKSEVISTDYYKPAAGLVRRGTKKA